MFFGIDDEYDKRGNDPKSEENDLPQFDLIGLPSNVFESYPGISIFSKRDAGQVSDLGLREKRQGHGVTAGVAHHPDVRQGV